MKHLCDANFWLALTRASHEHHERAVDWIQRSQESDTMVFCRATQNSYLRLLTNTKATHQPPLTNHEALRGYRELRNDFRIVWLNEPEDIESLWLSYAERPTSAPKIWIDAYLAAFAVLTKSRLVTFDKGFRVYKGLDWIDLNS